MRHLLSAATLLLLSASCSDVEEHDHHHHDHEVITTVGLTFAAQSDGSEVSFWWSDAEDDANPIVDDIILSDATDYDVSVTLLNELEDPAEPITPEIKDEGDEHQFFFTGSAVQGPATTANDDAIIEHAYADEDAGGLPIGIENTVSTLATGTGTLKVTLRHMPPEDGSAVKVSGAAAAVAEEGFGAIGGANDIQVTFNIEVE